MLNKILSLFLCFILSASIYSQNKYKTLNNSDIVEFRKKDGLPSNNFSSVVQTKDGYIWFSGPEGTFRFDGYEFAYLAEEYGIPEMQAIYYDSTKNVMYFASPENFASFDGIKFKTYNKSNGYKLKENQGQIISFVKGDSRGRIWVGSYTPFTDKHFNGSLISFKDDEFTLYDSLSFPLDNARDFIETPFGDLIFFSYGKNTQNGNGAYIALYKREKFTKIDGSFGFNYFNAIPPDEYSSYIDSRGNTWIPFRGSLDFAMGNTSSGTGVLIYDGDSFKDFPGLEKFEKNNLGVADLYCDNNDDNIYVSLQRGESIRISSSDVLIFELQNNKWVPSPIIDQINKVTENEDPNKNDFYYNFPRFLKGRRDSTVILAFSTFGISQSSIDPTQYFIKNGDNWIKYDAYNGIPILELYGGKMLSTAKGIGFLTPPVSKMFKKEDGVLFPEITIPGLYPDRNGLVWITYSYSAIPSYISLGNYGLNVWDGSKLRKITVEDGLKSNFAFTPYHDKEMNIWVPTDKGLTKVRELQNNKGEWIFRLKNIEMKNQKDYNTTDILETMDGELYVYQNYVRPKYGEVLKADFFLGKIIDDTIVEISSPFSKELQEQPYQLFFLREDSNGQIWLEGHFASSVEKLSSVPTKLKIFNGSDWMDPPDDWNVPNDQLHFVGELDNGAYYLTASSFYNFNGSVFIDLSDSTNQYADFKLLKGASVVGTMNNIQSGNNLYIRLRGRGLVIFDGKNINYLTPRNSIIPTDIHNPLVDHYGNVFFGSHAGGVKLSGKKASIYYDDEKIAAGGATTTAMDMNGNIIKFYTGVGIAVEKQIKKSNDVKISSITVNEKAYYNRFPTNLPYSENSLLFNYSVLNFSNPNQTMYEHILEGYDKEWSRTSNLSFTEYQNLPPGNFKFIVKATVANSEISKEASFSFVINPPFWNTWWAYLIYVSAGLGFLYSVRKVELKRQMKNAAIKEGKLRAEAAELQAKATEAQSKVIQAENDRKTEELEEARQLQLSMLPKDLPKIENLEIAFYMKTATEVGGDYYDYSIKEDGSLNICLGDATGHGMKAGTLVSMMKSLFIANSVDKNLIDFFKSSNISLKKSNMERMMMGFVMINFKDNNAELINAGLPPVYHYVKSENIIKELTQHNLPLGAMSSDNYKITEIELDHGDVLLIMTDGFPELQNDNSELFGYDRVKNAFAQITSGSPNEIINHLKVEGAEWVNGKDPDDDITFAVIKCK
ncbi:MAG: SpoIIE family protein phosphatase [Ignavibacteriae bacterium]|nr:hypothetical protein [Ignavibacteriota bacterium]NOG99175.1 SpoIIE family protein phosphatase [Ignavibacteriota bacterium]